MKRLVKSSDDVFDPTKSNPSSMAGRAGVFMYLDNEIKNFIITLQNVKRCFDEGMFEEEDAYNLKKILRETSIAIDKWEQ